MFNSKYKIFTAAFLSAALLTLSACGSAEIPESVQANSTVTESQEITETAAATDTPKTDSADKGTETTVNPAKTKSTAEKDTETSKKETESSPKETKPAETTTAAPPETTAVPEAASPAPLWTETPASGVMYINTEGIYSRKEAMQGSEKTARYSLNDAVNVTAKTDTDYFKLDNGSFIHSAYLSSQKTEITTEAPPTAATEAQTTAPTSVPETEAPAETTESTTGQYGQRKNTQSELDFIARTFELLNNERANAGLAAYQHLDVLDTIAAIRAWELTVAYRSDHIRPDGTSCTTAFNQNGIIYGAWGENVAAGHTTPEDVVNAWMNSPPHRAAILSDDYTFVGVGYYYSENDSQNLYHFWTLEFYRY